VVRLLGHDLAPIALVELGGAALGFGKLGRVPALWWQLQAGFIFAPR
jgi:hypothetical protein